MKRLIIGAGVAVAGVAGATAAVTAGSGHHARATGLPVATAEVTRGDLADTTDLDGTLAYKGSHALPGGGSGKVTWLPAEGAAISRGHRVYAVDGRPVPLFYGATPLWRTLSSGMTGADVRTLERNLAALGYGDDMTVDTHFTAATAAAVKDWQDDEGMTVTGTVGTDAVVVEPGAIRVGKVTAALGSAARASVATVSSTTRQVKVKLPVDQQQLAKVGAAVQVTLPGGDELTGHVSSIGKVASAGSNDQPGEGTQTATVPVYVRLSAKGGGLDGAPVTVAFTSGVRKGVLSVPVSALLAVPGGGYAVRSGGRQIPVELGLFADGRVEVTGAGLTEGTRVEVPKS